jgi:hypothetical protein
VKVLSTTEGSDDTAAGLLVLCALVCGLIMFRFYMQIGQTPRLGSAAAHWSTSAEVKTHRSLVRASNRVSEIPATKYGYSREAAEEITRRGSQIVKSAHSASSARAARVKRVPAMEAGRAHAPFTKGAYPGYAAQY